MAGLFIGQAQGANRYIWMGGKANSGRWNTESRVSVGWLLET